LLAFLLIFGCFVPTATQYVLQASVFQTFLVLSVIAEILKGNSTIWGTSLAYGHVHFSCGCDFMMGLLKTNVYTEFEAASFIRYGNISKFPPKI